MNKAVEKCKTCGCHPHFGPMNLINTVARRLISSGKFFTEIQRVPQHLIDRVSPHPLFSFGLDDFLPDAGPNHTFDQFVGRWRVAVAPDSNFWNRKSGQWRIGITEDEKSQVQYYERMIVVEFNTVMHVFNDEDGDEILLKAMSSALSKLVDCVLEANSSKVIV